MTCESTGISLQHLQNRNGESQGGSCSGSFPCTKHVFPSATLPGPDNHVPILPGSAASGLMLIQLQSLPGLHQAQRRAQHGPCPGHPSCTVLWVRMAQDSRTLLGCRCGASATLSTKSTVWALRTCTFCPQLIKEGSFPRDAAPWLSGLVSAFLAW